MSLGLVNPLPLPAHGVRAPAVTGAAMKPHSRVSGSLRGFTLVELLVVIGLIALLIGMLMPALSRVRERSMQVACASNLRQIGMNLLIYANESRGWLYPVGPPGADGLPTTLGSTLPPDQRWTVYVFHKWNPPIMLCPSDDQPAAEH